MNAADLSNLSDEEAAAIDTDEDAYEIWLFNHFIEHQYNSIYVCSSEGVLLRLSPYALDAARTYMGDFPALTSDQQALIEHLDDNFVHLSNELLTIDAKKEKWQSHFPEWVRIGQALLPLDGWPLCWKTPSEGFDDEAFQRFVIAFLSKTGPRLNSQPTRNRGGRPSLAPEILANFRQNYPNGMSGYTLTEISIHLGYDRKTTRCALRAEGYLNKSDEA